MENAKKLINEIEKQRNNWDERSQFKIKGVGNLSRSDLDSIEYYADTFIKTGNINNLMKAFGGVGEVLEKHGIKKTSIW